MAQHYLHSIGKRALAFKYKVKAADQAISRGAFNDGLQFAQSAAKLAVSKEELRVLLMVISRAVRDISAANGGTTGARRMSTTFNNLGTSNSNSNAESNFNNNTEVGQRMSTYIQLKISTEAALEKLSKGAVKSEEVTPGNKNRLVIHKQPSGKFISFIS